MRIRLAEALEALEAIRSGDVDALVVYHEGEEQVYTLHGADQPYRVMVETMIEGAATLSSDGLILWGNACLADMLDLPLESLLGTPIQAHLTPGSRAAFDAILARTPRAESKIEVDLEGSQGQHIPVLLSISPLQNPSHSADLCLVLTDLTEQKRNAEISAAERMAAAIIEQTAEAMVVCDAQGRIVRASRRAHHLAGDALLSQPFEQVFPLDFDFAQQEALPGAPEALPGAQPFSLAAVLRGVGFHGLEASLPRREPDGGTTQFSVTVSAAPLSLSQDGQIIGCVITMTDLTERKRAEQEVRRYARQLERSNKDLQDFAFVASHDLQEPLRKIRAFGSVLKQKYGPYLGEDGRDYIDRMQNAEERMRKMIEELLEYSRVSTKAQPFETVDINQIVQGVLSDLEVRILQTGGTVDVDPLPVIEADPMQMRQLLQNILSNALKFHQKNLPPRVRVKSETGDGGSQVRLLIEDNGIGFSMQHADLIFQPFQRLHGRGEYEGSGIGLAICRLIAERHNGQITATSEPGQGSTFIITLPVRQEKEDLFPGKR
jgi:signal transduction histidine kinase